jgi:predicted small lipoprotein YifL
MKQRLMKSGGMDMNLMQGRKKWGIYAVVLALLLTSLTGCSGVKKKGPASFTDMSADTGYAAAVEKHFTLGANARYQLTRVEDVSVLEEYPQADSAFSIGIHDSGEGKIRIVICYSVGAANANPTVVGKNSISGKSDITRTVDVTPSGDRAEAAIAAVHSLLTEAEGE